MFAGGDRLDVEQMLSDTQRMLENTRAFLDGTQEGDNAARDYLEGLKKILENEERRLIQKRDAHDPPRPEE